jgi:hypothetical protein
LFDEAENEDDASVPVDEVTLSPLEISKREVDQEWKLLVARSAARPLPTLGAMVVDQISKSIADIVVDGVEETRAELGIAAATLFLPLPSPFPQFSSATSPQVSTLMVF